MTATAKALMPLVAYLLVALGYTLPVWSDPAHLSAGTLGDNLHWMNFLAWTPHALAHLQNPLFMPVLDFPKGVNLAWNTSAPLAGFVMWPVLAVSGPIFAYNVFVIVAITLDGWCTYVWLHRHVRSRAAAFLGSLVVLLGPWIPAHITHLNLLAFWFLPLMFIAVENIVAGRSKRVRWELLLGVFAAAQFYLSEELAGLGIIAIITALMFALIVNRNMVRISIPRTVNALAAATLMFVILIAPFLIYQVAGPYPVHGPIQEPNTFVADLENLVVPTSATWLWPHGLTASMSNGWTGPAEATAYLGIPLIVAAIVSIRRTWRNRTALMVALTTGAMIVLSLGPHLHIGGADTYIPLPAIVLTHLPLADNVLPVRFSLLAAFGVAFLLQLAFDRPLLTRLWPERMTSLLGIAALATLISVLPLTTSRVTVPEYFSPSGGSSRLPVGTVALVGPSIDNDPASATPMLWQATSNFRFRMIDGMAVTTNPQGRPTFLLSTLIRRAFLPIQTKGILPSETLSLRAALLAELQTDHVTVAALGPMPHRDLAVKFMTWLFGTTPEQVQGVYLWKQLPQT